MSEIKAASESKGQSEIETQAEEIDLIKPLYEGTCPSISGGLYAV